VAVVVAVAGCGGSRTSDTAAILAALKASPTTYLHYTSRAWGHQLGMLAQVQVDGERATALITGRHLLKEHVSLRRRDGVWTITSDDGGVINGSRAERPATASELAAISTAERTNDPGSSSCNTYAAQVSTLNPRYARVNYLVVTLNGRCMKFEGNGEDLYIHTAAGWRHVISGDEFMCNVAPPGVARSLFGACLLPNLLVPPRK
jgi:hypothetical protein